VGESGVRGERKWRSCRTAHVACAQVTTWASALGAAGRARAHARSCATCGQTAGARGGGGGRRSGMWGPGRCSWASAPGRHAGVAAAPGSGARANAAARASARARAWGGGGCAKRAGPRGWGAGALGQGKQHDALGRGGCDCVGGPGEGARGALGCLGAGQRGGPAGRRVRLGTIYPFSSFYFSYSLSFLST
jgi:hypothetical protein